MSVFRLLLSAVLLLAFACGPGQEESPAAPPGEEASKPLPVAFTPRLDHDLPGKPTSTDSDRLHAAAVWTVNLTDNGPAYVGAPITFTATANHDVGPTVYYIIIRSVTGDLIGSCGTGTTCTGQYILNSPGEVFVYAYIERADGSDEQASSQNFFFATWETGNPKLSASPTTVPIGATSTVTAKVDLDVAPSPWYIQIYDVNTQTRIASCGSGKTCSVTVTQSVATTHRFQAYVSSYTTVYPPPDAIDNSHRSYVTWNNSGYTLSLSSPSGVCWNCPTAVTATANVDMGGTSYYITIFRQETGERLTSCGWGTTCTGYYQAPQDSYIHYAAFISADSTTFLPANIQASANTTATYTDLPPIP